MTRVSADLKHSLRLVDDKVAENAVIDHFAIARECQFGILSLARLHSVSIVDS